MLTREGEGVKEMEQGEVRRQKTLVRILPTIELIECRGASSSLVPNMPEPQGVSLDILPLEIKLHILARE